MRDLWRGLAMITFDEELRNAVSNEAKCVKKEDKAKKFLSEPQKLQERLEIQPDLGALRAIDKMFREKGLVLSVYALAEINRWFFGESLENNKKKTHKRDFLTNLDLLKTALKPFQGPEFNGFNTRSPAFMEAIGALVADPELRDNFLKNTMTLRAHGFQLSPEEEDALRHGFEPGSSATASAKDIHEIGWPDSSSCTSRLLVYDQLFHINQ
jgi:hypothetical protein